MATVLERTLTLTAADEKTNVLLSFEVPYDGEEMKITFSYAPKYLTDEVKAKKKIYECLIRDGYEDEADSLEKYLPLGNLITLSLDDPTGYRGCAHRQAPSQEHILSEENASPGFLKGKILHGQWRAVINVHALVTDECEVHIKADAKGENYD